MTKHKNQAGEACATSAASTPKPTPTLAELWWEIYNEGDSPTEALALKIRAALERLDHLEKGEAGACEQELTDETLLHMDLEKTLRAENAALKLESKDFLSVLARIASIALAHGWKNDGEYLLSAFINDTLNAAESRATELAARVEALEGNIEDMLQNPGDEYVTDRAQTAIDSTPAADLSAYTERTRRETVERIDTYFHEHPIAWQDSSIPERTRYFHRAAGITEPGHAGEEGETE